MRARFEKCGGAQRGWVIIIISGGCIPKRKIGFGFDSVLLDALLQSFEGAHAVHHDGVALKLSEFRLSRRVLKASLKLVGLVPGAREEKRVARLLRHFIRQIVLENFAAVAAVAVLRVAEQVEHVAEVGSLVRGGNALALGA